MTFKGYDELKKDAPAEQQPEAPLGPNYVGEGEGKTFCAVHPTVETSLKCNKCGRYMCSRCAVRTPVGYRCRECVYQQAGAFFKATSADQFLGAIVGFVVALPLGFVLSRPDFIFLTIIFSLPAGALIGEAVFRVMGRRKGRYTAQIVVLCIVAAAILCVLPSISEFLKYMQVAGDPQLSEFQGGGQIQLQLIFSYILPAGVFAVLSSITAASRLK